MEYTGRIIDINITGAELSSVRIKRDGDEQPVIVSMSLKEAAALAPLAHEHVTLTIERAIDEGSPSPDA
jgi:hypothetical protein